MAIGSRRWPRSQRGRLRPEWPPSARIVSTHLISRASHGPGGRVTGWIFIRPAPSAMIALHATPSGDPGTGRPRPRPTDEDATPTRTRTDETIPTPADLGHPGCSGPVR